MRAILILVVLWLVQATPALAGKNARGALIVHCLDLVDYTGTQDFCETEYDDPGSCEGAVTRANNSPAEPTIVWTIAAWHETSNPGVTVVYSGLDHNLPGGSFGSWSLCGPAGSIEIPDTGWPIDPNAGNSLAFGSPIVGNRLFPYYWFLLYGFDGAYFGTAINPTGGYAAFVSDDVPPILDECFRFGQARWYEPGFNECPEPPALGACCFMTGECQLLLLEECEEAGGEFLGDGSDCDPNPCPLVPGACCFADGHCEVFTGIDCEQYNGVWSGPGSVCDPNPCDQPPEACCFASGDCTFVPPVECEQAGGTPQGAGTTCEQVACKAPALGACCLEDDACQVTLEEDCAELGGIFSEGVPCEPNPCGTATETATWGQIKVGFR